MENFSENLNQDFYSDENFSVREKLKHDVRLLKEYLYECEIIYADGKIPSENITVEQLKEKIAQKIEPLVRFGANDW